MGATVAATPTPTARFRGLVERTYPRGHHLYEAGDAADRLLILQRGQVRLSRVTQHGRRLITETLRPGQICGDEAVRPGAVYGWNAVTAQPTTVIAVSHRALHELALARPELLITLLARLEERLEHAGEQLVEVTTRCLPSRVAAALLRQMAGCARPVLELTHQDVTDMAGTRREVATCVLDSLCRRGAIRLSRGRVEVLNTELLAAVGDESA